MQSKQANLDKKTSDTKIDLKTIEWNKYMVYIVFVIVFLAFSIFFRKQGFFKLQQSVQYSKTNVNDLYHGRCRNFCIGGWSD